MAISRRRYGGIILLPHDNIPILFNIYMKLLREFIQGSGLWCHQYADDTQLYFSFSSKERQLLGGIWGSEAVLRIAMDWMRANKSRPNPKKTYYLWAIDLSK